MNAAAPDTLLGVLRLAEGYFAERGVDAPRRSAELLCGHVLGMSRLQLYLAHDRPLSERERQDLRMLVKRRSQHEPLAHLLGEQEFCGLSLHVDRHVLVPRPETEHLVDLAAKLAPPSGRVVDLGTGSGAIGVALAARRADVTVVATDVSRPALAVARRNVLRHGLEGRVHLVGGSWWEPFAAAAPGGSAAAGGGAVGVGTTSFDLVVSNPPYVDPARTDLLAADVRRYEPHVALFGAPGDPAVHYRAIVGGLTAHARSGAWVLLETGVEAADAALDVLRRAPCVTAVELRADLAGLPRYLMARMR